VEQRNPREYLYSENAVVFKVRQFESVPPGCEITYSCIGVNGEDPDVKCDIPGVTTWDGIFDGDKDDGTFTF
jgi:hypothetical protein